MYSVNLLSSLALAGSIFAAPILAIPVPEPKLVVLTEWSTVYVTAGVGVGVGVGLPQPTAVQTTVKPSAAPFSSSKSWAAPSSSSKPIIVQTSSATPSSAKPTTTQPTTAKPTTMQAQTSSAKPTTTAAASSSSDPAYMAIVNKWRGNMGLPLLSFSATLQANALKTCNDGNGKMVHELNPGTFGQVLAPGDANGFEKVFVGGWLCEVPTTRGLNNACSTYSQGWNYQGQTGHNAILISTKYTKIGCALAKGIWGCDLAY